MVKRMKTPPPGDKVRILCIVEPYPLREKYDFEAHSGAELYLFQWLRQFIEPEAIYALYWRPKDDNLLVSVRREADHFYDKILGEHHWSRFLLECPPEHKNKTTKIFYSTFEWEREAQKLGWREKHIDQDVWRVVQTGIFRVPYPKSTYVENTYDHCRAIPALKRPDARDLGIVPGTMAYAQISGMHVRTVPGAPPRVVPGAPPGAGLGLAKPKRKKKPKMINGLPLV